MTASVSSRNKKRREFSLSKLEPLYREGSRFLLRLLRLNLCFYQCAKKTFFIFGRLPFSFVM